MPINAVVTYGFRRWIIEVVECRKCARPAYNEWRNEEHGSAVVERSRKMKDLPVG